MTVQQKASELTRIGFIVGPRDPKRNPGFPGEFMVAQEGQDEFCIVGDTIEPLIEEAYEMFCQS